MFDNEYVLTEKVLDSSNLEVQDSNLEAIFSRVYSDLLKKFMEGIPNSFSISGKLRDNSFEGSYSIDDSVDDPIMDSVSRGLNGKDYSSLKILDSLQNQIDCIGTFVS